MCIRDRSNSLLAEITARTARVKVSIALWKASPIASSASVLTNIPDSGLWIPDPIPQDRPHLPSCADAFVRAFCAIASKLVAIGCG